MAELKKYCEICGNTFEPTTSRNKYCSEECAKAAVRGRTYKYEAKKKPHAEEDKRGTPEREGNMAAASRRWATMSLKEISRECARLHLTYGQAQVMAQSGTLPNDFGLECVR